jgi:GNAT superfamily N-acetyltransferase
MGSEDPLSVRVATPADVDSIVAAITTAFFDDPLWGPAFPDADKRAAQAERMWRLFVTSSMRYPWMLVTTHCESAALWIPPGGAELTPAEESDFEVFMTGVAGRDVTAGILRIFEELDRAHPHEPHYYLSLLATHDVHRGKGFGMALLRASLARIDAAHMPAYLESTNPANLKRYESVGFVERDRITMPSGAVVTTMWRPAR